MQKIRFEEALKLVLKEDQRFEADGYHFLRDALDNTVKKLRGDELIEHRHVSGPELIEGLIEFAIAEYGSMASIVLDSWGIRSGEDVGEMVFKLIEVGAFGKSEEDALADFVGVKDLRAALRQPFRPSRQVLRGLDASTRQGDDSNGERSNSSGYPQRKNKPATPADN